MLYSGTPRENLFSLFIIALVLLTAMPVHECAHGYVAYRLGDDTARRQGRLTLNPFRHLSLAGSIMMLLTGFGFAKSVPVDPRNFKRPKRDMALTAVAGPLSNILLSLICLILLKFGLYFLSLPQLRSGIAARILGTVVMVLPYIILINLRLAVFNILPIPPLDGSKFFGAILPQRLYGLMLRYERYIALVLLVLLWFGYLSKPLNFLATQVLRFLYFLTGPLDLLLR